MSTPKVRNCSFLFSKDRRSVICHSAAFLSTFRLSADASTTVFPKNGFHYQRKNKAGQDAFHAAVYWLAQEQPAVNAFIESIQIGTSLDDAEHNAFAASRPGWVVTVKRPKQAFAGGSELTAERPSGKAVERVGAATWRHLHYRTA